MRSELCHVESVYARIHPYPPLCVEGRPLLHSLRLLHSECLVILGMLPENGAHLSGISWVTSENSEIGQLQSFRWWWWKSHWLHFTSSFFVQVRQEWNRTALRKDAFVILWLSFRSQLISDFSSSLRKVSFLIPSCSPSRLSPLEQVRWNSRAVMLLCLLTARLWKTFCFCWTTPFVLTQLL